MCLNSMTGVLVVAIGSHFPVVKTKTAGGRSSQEQQDY